MRVASSDWWASRKVVSVTATSFASRSGRREGGRPVGDEPVAGTGRQRARRGSWGSLVRGRTRVVTGPLGWLTVTSAR